MQHEPDFTLLDHIDPAALSYDDWVSVGMAIHHEGGTLEQYTAWSARDAARFHGEECTRKWLSFNGDGVTWGTVVHLAKAQGWTPPPKHTKGKADYTDETRRYLNALFRPGEQVRIVTAVYSGKDGKYHPGPGRLYPMDGLLKDITTIGKTNPAGGVFVAVNPLADGIKQEHVTAFRHALIESDNMPTKEQERIIREMNLPCAAVVHSGGKSIHAIVKVDAASLEQYKERVRYLHDACFAYGLSVDKANKDGGRLSRLPGYARGERRQSLLAVNTGAPSWEAWVEEIEGGTTLEPSRIAGSGPMPAPLFRNGPIPGGFGLFIGQDSIGKGWVCLDLMLSCALARPLNIRTVSHAGDPLRVMYLCYEDQPAALEWRLDRLCESAGVDPSLWRTAEKQGMLSILADDLAPLWTQAKNDIPRPTDMFRALERHIRRHKVNCCIVDPLAAAAVLQSENDNAALNAVAVQFRALAKRTGCACILVHHTAKGAQGNTSHHASRGGSALPGAGRWQLQLSQESRNKPLYLSITKNSYGRRVFDVPLLQEDNGVIRELSSEEESTNRATLVHRVVEYIREHPDACINAGAVKLRNSQDAKALITAMAAAPAEVHDAIQAALFTGELAAEERKRPGRNDTFTVLVPPKNSTTDDDDEEALF